MASESDVFTADFLSWRSDNDLHFLPRFIFQRTPLPKPRIELGIFAGMNGDDPGSIRGVTELLRALNAHPTIGREYRLWLYPLCNPVGYANWSAGFRTGRNLSREIWKNSRLPEVRLLEQELRERRFDGIICLEGGFLGSVVQAHLWEKSRKLDFVTPALALAQQTLPLGRRAEVADFRVRKRDRKENFLACPTHSHNTFEILLEVPRQSSVPLQGEIFLVVLHALLAGYRRISSVENRQFFAA